MNHTFMNLLILTFLSVNTYCLSSQTENLFNNLFEINDLEFESASMHKNNDEAYVVNNQDPNKRRIPKKRK